MHRELSSVTMSIHFDQPVWLWLLALSVPMAVAGAAWFSSMSMLRRWTCIVSRIVLIAAIAAMLAGATAVRTTESLATIAILDHSGSVASFFESKTSEGEPVVAMEAMRRALAGGLESSDRRADDRAGIVLLGARASAWAAPTRGDPLVEALEVPTTDGTDIAAAIRLARAMVPADSTGRIVLFTDGNQTSGDALAEARLARAAGTPIDVVPLRYSVRSEVIVESVDAPSVAPANAPVVVRVSIRSTGPARGTLELLNNGVSIDTTPDEPGTGRRLTLEAGRRVELIETVLPAGRVHRFEAVFLPDAADPARPELGFAADRVVSNNRAEAVTFSSAAGMILQIDGVGGGNPTGEGATLKAALEASGLQVQLVSPDAAPRDLLALEAFDLVLLSNVAAESLREESVAALSRYVTELAGGLVMIGGPDSFGAGGWKDTLIEPLLPVLLDLPEQLIKPSAAVVLVLDNSGSMNFGVMGSHYSQQEIANEGAALAIESMDKTDLVGVITFNSDFRVRIPLDRNRDPKKSAEVVRAITAGGGTDCGPALRAAGEMLDAAAEQAEVRHIVVLSDGKSKGAEQLPQIARELAARGIKVSTIAVGMQADSLTMAEMAAEGEGRFYRVTDPTVLPRILVKAVRVVRSPLVREGDFEPLVLATGSPLVQGLSQGMPPLGGLVLTQPREEPTVVYAMMTPSGEPLLAHWNAGLGRVAAFTSDAHDWAGRWVQWPGYGQLWTQIARTISRPATDRRQELSMSLDGDVLRLRLDASDASGQPLDLMSVAGAVYAPNGERTEVRLSQSGPGRYEATLPAEQGGTYIATLAPQRNGRAMSPVVGGLSRARGFEYANLRSNDELLAAIAAESGGRIIELADLSTSNLFDRASVRPQEARLPLWPLLLVWSVGLMLVDIGTRRIAWDRLLSREFGATLRRDAAAAMKGRGAEAAAASERLRRFEPALGNAGTNAAAGTLSADDAVAIVREQAERRRQSRQRGVVPASQAAPAADKPAAPSPPERTGPARPDVEAPEEEAGGLLAAKRRARKRIDEQREEA